MKLLKDILYKLSRNHTGNMKRGLIGSSLSLMVLVALISLSACTDDNISQPSPDDNSAGSIDMSDKILITFDISTDPTTRTRSTTIYGGDSSGDSNGKYPTENSQSLEEVIKTVYISFLTQKTGSWSAVDISEPVSATVDGHTITVVAPVSLLKEIAGQKVKVRLVANYAGEPSDDQSVISMGDSILAAPLGAYKDENYQLPMANYEEFKFDITALEYNNDAQFLTDLMELVGAERKLNVSTDTKIIGGDGEKTAAGNLQLERCVARIDYKPYGWTYNSTTNAITTKPQVYKVGEVDDSLYARMYDLQLFNVSKESYVFRNVSEGDLSTGKRTGGSGDIIFGRENFNQNFEDFDDKYKFDDDLEENTSGSGEETENGEGDEDPVATPIGKDYYNWIQDSDWGKKSEFYTASLNSTWAGPSTGEGSTPVYNYFLNQPTKGNNEPFYFVHPGADNKLYGNLNVYDIEKLKTKYMEDVVPDGFMPLWYVSENTLPSTAAMINGLTTGLAFRMVLCNKDGKPLSPSDFGTDDTKKVKGKLEAAGNGYGSQYFKLTIGSREVYAEKVTRNGTDLYLVTYYYYFRHNISKNHILGTVEPMQFGVVRNNIYKVSVASLNGLPEPYDPGKPDEPQENVISVETAILSWARSDIDVKL